MIVVTVARKPLQEPTVAANVQAGGLGGLNIDGSRIGTGGGHAHPPAEKYGKASGPVYGAGISAMAAANPINAGRWPANLVLEHLPGCKETGETRRMTRNVPSGKWCPGKQDLFRGLGNGMATSNEVVSVWACAPGCPVAEMDLQSGISVKTPSKGGVPNAERAGLSGLKGMKLNLPSTLNDAGGASRFFRTIKRDTPLPEYEEESDEATHRSRK